MIAEQIQTNITKGRGAQFNTPNKFTAQTYAAIHPEAIDDWETDVKPTQYLQDNSKTIVNKITSQDIPFMYSLNPYQGCEHGCSYCFARNTHEYWGYSAGTDFEQKIIVKRKAPDLLRNLFSSKKWHCTPIALSSNTDCYQPIERKEKITRQLLEVCLEYKNPVSILTKNALILRDLDLLQELAKHNLVSVATSITSMDEKLRQVLEPRTSTYLQRMKIIETLAKENIYCGVMNAPIIPGINDTHMYEVLRQASLYGASWAGYTIVRLNGAIGSIFKDWLHKHFADRAQKVWHLIESCHGGQVNDSRPSLRMSGEGKIAEMIKQQFMLHCNQFGLNKTKHTLNTFAFERLQKGQLRLF
jgi:DNA repair photolyase